MSGNFGYMGRSNPWGDLDQMWRVGRYGGRNHVCNIWWLSVKGCGCGERGKFAFSNWLDASPLQHWSHYRVTVWCVRPIGSDNIKQQIHHLKGRRYNKNSVLYPGRLRWWKYICCFICVTLPILIGLTHCYKTTVFYIYISRSRSQSLMML